MFETSKAETIWFDDSSETVIYIGRHHGYERLPEPMTHERTFTFEKSTGVLLIVDRLAGRGRHELHWHFHFAPGVAAAAADGAVALEARGRRCLLKMPPGLSLTISPAGYSPSYGVAVPCLAADVRATVDLDGSRTWEFAFVP